MIYDYDAGQEISVFRLGGRKQAEHTNRKSVGIASSELLNLLVAMPVRPPSNPQNLTSRSRVVSFPESVTPTH